MDKLEKVLKWRAQLEKNSAELLAAGRAQRAQAEQQHNELERLAQEYREQHLMKKQASALQHQHFLRFYEQLNLALQAHDAVVTRLETQESTLVEKYVVCHRDRRALEKLLQQREAAHKTDVARKDRRMQRPGRSNPMV